MQKSRKMGLNQKKHQSIETDPEMTAPLESASKDLKAAFTNIFKGLKKNTP